MERERSTLASAAGTLSSLLTLMMQMRKVAVALAAAGAMGLSSLSARQQSAAPDRTRLDLGARLYAQNCMTCHGPQGDAQAGVNLRTGQFKRAVTDLDIMNTILQGVPGTAMAAHEMSSGDLVALVAYIRVMKDYGTRANVVVGDRVRGKAIFEGKGGCLNCHRVGDRGSYLGPDLTEIGGSRSAGALEDTLLDPQSNAQPGNRSIRAVLKNGEVVTGRRLNEDTWSVQIMDSHEKLVSLWKPDLKEYTIIKSTMPSYKDTLSASERADLIGYLLSLAPETPIGGRGAGGRGRGAAQ
jgi:putative heme-binding domain-containing protein